MNTSQILKSFGSRNIVRSTVSMVLMLLPAVGHARENTQNTGDISDLPQIALGLASGTQAYDTTPFFSDYSISYNPFVKAKGLKGNFYRYAEASEDTSSLQVNGAMVKNDHSASITVDTRDSALVKNWYRRPQYSPLGYFTFVKPWLQINGMQKDFCIPDMDTYRCQVNNSQHFKIGEIGKTNPNILMVSVQDH